jgi:cbb3-type cytochrome oxidase maturation protein
LTILFLLIPLAIVLMGTAVTALLWALREGQFDDLDSPGVQLILDDDRAPRVSTDADGRHVAAGADHPSTTDGPGNEAAGGPASPGRNVDSRL